MEWLLLGTSLTIVTLQCALTNHVSKKGARSPRELYLFNLIGNLVSMLCLLAYGGIPRLSSFTLWLGVAFGTAVTLSGLFRLLALRTGSMCYTQLITSSNMIIPALSGAILWAEPLGAWKLAGAALVLVSMALSIEYRSDRKATWKWFVLAILSFFFCGLIGVMQKVLGHSAYADEKNGFLLVAFAVSTALSAVICACGGRRPAEQGEKLRLRTPMLLSALGVGIGTAAVHILNLYLANAMPAIVFFPLVNGGNLLLATAVAFLFFHERLNRLQTVGFCIGIAAVLLLCLG